MPEIFKTKQFTRTRKSAACGNSITQGDCYSLWIKHESGFSQSKSILSKWKKQPIWRVYMSLSLFTEECMMKPVGNSSVHTNDLKLCSSSTTGSGTRSGIFEAASDGEEKHWLPSLVLHQNWSVPVSFIITAHSQVSKWGWVGGNRSRQQHNFFLSFVVSS